MQYELQDMVLQVFVDVAINHNEVEFAKFTQNKIIHQTFFFPK